MQQVGFIYKFINCVFFSPWKEICWYPHNQGYIDPVCSIIAVYWTYETKDVNALCEQNMADLNDTVGGAVNVSIAVTVLSVIPGKNPDSATCQLPVCLLTPFRFVWDNVRYETNLTRPWQHYTYHRTYTYFDSKRPILFAVPYVLTYLVTYLLTHLLTYSLTHLLTDSLTHLLT